MCFRLVPSPAWLETPYPLASHGFDQGSGSASLRPSPLATKHADLRVTAPSTRSFKATLASMMFAFSACLPARLSMDALLAHPCWKRMYGVARSTNLVVSRFGPEDFDTVAASLLRVDWVAESKFLLFYALLCQGSNDDVALTLAETEKMERTSGTAHAILRVCAQRIVETMECLKLDRRGRFVPLLASLDVSLERCIRANSALRIERLPHLTPASQPPQVHMNRVSHESTKKLLRFVQRKMKSQKAQPDEIILESPFAGKTYESFGDEADEMHRFLISILEGLSRMKPRKSAAK